MGTGAGRGSRAHRADRATAKASGVPNLLPASAQNWVEYLAEEYNEAFASSASATGRLYLAYAVLDQAIIGHAIQTESGDIDVSTLTTAQRSAAVECLRTIAERARAVMQRLVIYAAASECILSTHLDQLDGTDRRSGTQKSSKRNWELTQPPIFCSRRLLGEPPACEMKNRDAARGRANEHSGVSASHVPQNSPGSIMAIP